MINRYSAPYYPFLPIINDIKNFQIDKFNQYGTFFNIYDKNFGGINISATGIWDEVQGNIISSLFCKENDIEIIVEFSISINYKELLIKQLDINDLLINGNNDTYLSKINKNINSYILESYTDYILDNFYYLDTVLNQNNQRVEYTQNNKTSSIIEFKDNNIYNGGIDSLKLIFKRK
jgi:hypothetical protein